MGELDGLGGWTIVTAGPAGVIWKFQVSAPSSELPATSNARALNE